MCQIDVLYGKSLIIDFLDDFLKKRTAIMGPGPGSGFESQTRAHCDSKILYLLSTALFKIYLHMYINGFSVYLKNIYAYLCFLSCAALLYPIYQLRLGV